MKKMAVYGKGGIGKSTICSNLAVAWAQSGLEVMLVGCDPKADSTFTILGHRAQILLNRYEKLYEKSEYRKIESDSLYEIGFAGIKCVEIGGPRPGVGCAGRGISLALELLKKTSVFESLDLVIFDILGDVLCGGFAVPMRMGFTDEVYIITSGEYASLYAANNICRGIMNMRANLGGIIANCRGIPDEILVVSEFANGVGSSLLGTIPKSPIFPKCEYIRKTILEAEPKSQESQTFRDLSSILINNNKCIIPQPMEDNKLDKLIYNLMY